MCQNEKYCRKGLNCKYAHTIEEVSYHPVVYKVQNCRYEKLEGNTCKNKGSHCSYAHDDEDRRVPGLQPEKAKFDLKSFQTEKCKRDNCQDEDCLDYHNVFQRRRNIDSHRYDPVPCMLVFRNKKFLESSVCPNEDDCNKAHTKNEIYFHPSFYKTKLCQKESCSLHYCPFLHPSTIPSDLDNPKVVDSEIKEKHEVIVSDSPVPDAKSPDPIIEVKPIKAQEDIRSEMLRKFLCKKCETKAMEWLFECGIFVCGDCLDQECVACRKKHVTRLLF